MNVGITFSRTMAKYSRLTDGFRTFSICIPSVKYASVVIESLQEERVMMEMSTIAKQHEEQRHLEANGLYSSQFEKDACGMGFVVNIKGKKSMISSMMACVFLSVWSTVVVLAPIRILAMEQVS